MKNHIQNALIFSLIFFLVFFLTFCQEKTDEELILEMMEDVGKYAEKKDMSSIMINLADDYHDFEGRGKKETQDMINEYYERYRGIAINMLSTQIEEFSSLEASIQTEVAFSSGAAKVFRKLIRYSTENYRLKIKLIKRNDRWQIQYAEWKYVTLNELFPESLSILKKIFPDL
jgi:hypothetical protein